MEQTKTKIISLGWGHHWPKYQANNLLLCPNILLVAIFLTEKYRTYLLVSPGFVLDVTGLANQNWVLYLQARSSYQGRSSPGPPIISKLHFFHSSRLTQKADLINYKITLQKSVSGVLPLSVLSTYPK